MPLRKMCSPPPLGGWFCTYLSNPPDTMCIASPHFLIDFLSGGSIPCSKWGTGAPYHCVSVLSCLQICSSWLHPLGAVMGARLDLPLLHPVIDFTLHRSAITFGSLVTTCALKSLSSDVATSPCSRTWRVFLLPSLSARVGLDAATRLCRQPVVESPKDPLSRCGLLTGEVNPFIFQLSPDR